MVPPPRAGTFSPSPAQALQTGSSHSPHPSQAAALGASPVTGSPTGTSSVSKIVIAQVFVLLSSIKEEKDDPSKWEQLKKLIDESGMEVFTKYFARLVASSASQIFPGLNRPGGSPGSYQLLTSEMQKIPHDPEQARRIAESIEIGTEDIFRDFDLSTFMEHFKLDALEKTILALAFKLGPRSELKTKADAILSTNFPTFVNIITKPDGDHEDLDANFVSVLVDRFIQLHPPNFNAAAKSELAYKVSQRYEGTDLGPPPEVLAALDLMRVLADKPANALALFIQKTGADFTRDQDACVSYLQSRQAAAAISEEQVSVALTYTTVSQTPTYNPSVFVAALRQVLPASFRWQDVVAYFDQRSARTSPPQFLRLYNALVPIAREDTSATPFDVQHLWGGNWENPETQLSFISAFASLSADQLDATTIPGIQPTFTVEDYANAPPEVRERAAQAAKHPLVSLAAISAIFHVALHSQHASTNTEAQRLFQTVVVPNLDIFVVSAFGVPKPWPSTAAETLNSLFENFLYKRQPNWDFVFDSLWRKDKQWVIVRLIDAHASQPGELPLIFEHAVKHNWLNELIYLPNGFGLDLVAYAHGQGYVDLAEWAKNNTETSAEIARPLMQFLLIKSELETQRADGQQIPAKANVPMKVRTVSALLNILEDFFPKTGPIPDLVMIQRQCIAIYPRLINYGEGYDDIIEANEKTSHALPQEANAKMEEHFKKMYSNEIEVRDVVKIMEHYKHSRDPLEQDIFSCMISNSLFEEYSHFGDYPLEALATTAVLFGGLISHKLISDLPLKIGLGMILEAVRDHKPDHPMFKFGMQALMQLYSRFREWPGFCRQLLQCKSLQGTEAWKKAEDVVRDSEEEAGRAGGPVVESLTNGNVDDASGSEQHFAPFVSVNVDPPPADVAYEDPNGDAQGKIQFVLNNITASTLQAMFLEVRSMIERKHQQWFASHLVEERAKMQPNYHKVYLQLVSHFEDKALWSEVLRETYVSVARMLNSEVTMQNSTERTHLKNLGGWLGLLTLARDKPIRHRNIAFKQLLIEAHDTKRLIVVIPFVCKVLSQGEHSNVFKPPNPWLMDIIHFLIDLYHNAELKLNLKFEIEVLCQTLSIDHKSIEPSGEILNRMAMEAAAELAPDPLDTYDSLSLNGLTHAGVGAGAGIAAHSLVPNVVSSGMVAMIPELITKVHVPPVSEMVISATRLEDIVRDALIRALQDIIQPVVDRSVAIAAIATQQMIHKDFATEPDENRVRTAAVSMAKATAGSLALVTSKEPLRANLTNYLRTLSSDLPQGLPEGTIIMCVNSNLDYGSSVIEKATEERAAYEIEEMIEPEVEARRRHRMQRPNDPYVDPSLSRWAMTIPNPYKLSPSMTGLNEDQMAIYEDFARHSRLTASSVASAAHVASASDATRALANEVLQDQYSSLPNVPTPAETPSVASVGSQLPPYPHVHGATAAVSGAAGAMVNGRQTGPSVDVQVLVERVQKLVLELQRAATDAPEEHFSDLPRPHPVLDVIDALVQTIIKAQQSAEDFAIYAAEQVCPMLFSPLIEDSLALESLVHVLETLRKIAGPTLSSRVTQYFRTRPDTAFLRLPLISALLGTDLLDWPSIDNAMAISLKQRKDGSIIFLMRLLDLALFSDAPLILYADFVNSLSEAWSWVEEEPDVPGGQEFKTKVLAPIAQSTLPSTAPQEPLTAQRKDQIEYVFDEWVRLCQNPNMPDNVPFIFVEQMRARGVVASREDLFVFVRVAVDKSVERFELNMHAGGTLADGYAAIDAVAKVVAIFVQACPDEETPAGEQSARAELLDSVLALAVMLVNHHYVQRGDGYNQRVFFRLFSMLLVAVNNISDHLSDADRNAILLRFATRFNDLGPATFPYFVYAWTELIKHRIFMPALLRMPAHVGWPALTKNLQQLLRYTSEQLKVPEASNFAKDLYRAVVKLLLILYHDFPDYLAANHIELCQGLSPYLVQPLNIILFANPSSMPKLPDPMLPGLQLDRMDEAALAPVGRYDPVPVLARLGLTALLDQALEAGPSEEVVAHIKYAIGKSDTKSGGSTWGKVPLTTNTAVVDAVVTYIGQHAAARTRNGGPVFTAEGADTATLSMVLHELAPEGRYYFLCSMVNQLRYPNAHTSFFGLVLLELFGRGPTDPEETEIREQICRVLFERIVNYWPQPWGLLVVIVELVKNDKFFFFDLPFLKVAPEVSERFASLVTRS
ncbi:ccr4-not transcription complex subunit [Niveomyces insectorum RCEF 264]|uniref:General negative regulator of transcription subunit 1 n=1 Tax=Niveomyces insectorum RCEF 264 TaxID=1081102 RepID=A0A167ZVT1_9HYPO|nr:ccr4-not transcription complex subunit [Niveomyces insectorum RCEF 264]